VNLKAELEIMSLHEKMDTLRQHQWEELMTVQKEQIQMLTSLVENLRELKPNEKQVETQDKR
jgi:uncharacterized membrane protein